VLQKLIYIFTEGKLFTKWWS